MTSWSFFLNRGMLSLKFNQMRPPEGGGGGLDRDQKNWFLSQ